MGSRYAVHNIAADLKMSDDQLLDICVRLGIEADAPSSPLDERAVRKIKHSIARAKIEKVEEAERKRREEQERKKAETEAKKRAEAEKKRKAADAKKAEAKRKKAEAAKKKAESDRKKREKEEKQRLEAERKKREEEERKKEEEHKKREEARRLAEEEIRKKEEAEKKKHEAELRRKKIEEEKAEEARIRAEEKARLERIKEMKQKLRIVELDKLSTIRTLASKFGSTPKEMTAKLEELGLKVPQTAKLDKDILAIYGTEIGYEIIFKGKLATQEEKEKAKEVEAKVEQAIRDEDDRSKQAIEDKQKTEDVEKIAEKKRPERKTVKGERVKVLTEEEIPDDPKDLIPRPPIVTIMGHVDHGKTSILDYIRKSRIAAGEKGSITQHIGAYKITHKGHEIVFIDTPGHEAFTEMRARGAKVTDIVVLVVAADDGIMPQTVEAINHARSANVPIIVAINKIDKPTGSPAQIKQQLMQYQLLPEEWGGETIVCEVSATTGAGIDHLLEMIGLQAEVLELKANPKRKVSGVVIESEISKGRGAVGTVIVNRGTLKVGDIVVCGKSYGKIRALTDENNKRLKSAVPGTPVEIMGLSEPPPVGETIRQAESESGAREEAEKYAEEEKLLNTQTGKLEFSLDDFLKGPDEETKELRLVIKGDAQGTLEALAASLEKVGTEKAKVKILHSAVGNVGESDVMLARASGAMIIAFSIKADQKAVLLAEREKVKINYYDIIYHAIEEMRMLLEGLLEPIFNEVTIGKAEIRQVFESSSLGMIAGCFVQTGIIAKNAKARLFRKGDKVWEGEVAGLKRFKDEAREVKAGMECGLRLNNCNDIQVGDIVESVRIERLAQTL